MAAEVIVVLGCRTNPDGTASEMMQYRLKKAAEIYNSLKAEDKPHPWVVVSGYQAPGVQVITEAKAMFNYIQEKELLPAEHVIIEEQATNTAGNAYWSRIIVDNLGADQVHVVTTKFHLPRAKEIFDKVYSPEIYKVYFHDSMQELDEEAQKFRDFSEDILTHTVDQDLAEVPFKIKQSPDGKSIAVLNSPLFNKDIFLHGFSTRFGGVSTWKTLSSLNLMYNPKRRDPRVNVSENRQRLGLHCGYDFQKFHMAKCMHENGVWVVGDPEPESYDALVTNKPAITIAAPGSDCSILLFCDPVRKVCGAAHSGWRGTLANISQEVVRVMKERFACEVKNIFVAVGPTIGPCCFEVGEEVAEKFAEICNDVVVRKENKPKPFVDLRKTTRLLLEKSGVLPENIDDGSRDIEGITQDQRVTQCTYCDPKERFFSYRRDGSQYGTQIGLISLRVPDKSQPNCCIA